MSKDPTKNVDRYKVRGGHINEFEFVRHHNELSHEQDDRRDPNNQMPFPSEQEKVERIRELLAQHGESAPTEQTTDRPDRDIAQEAKHSAQKSTDEPSMEQPSPPAKPSPPAEPSLPAQPSLPVKTMRAAPKKTSKAKTKPARKTAKPAKKSVAKSASRSTTKASSKSAVKPARKTTKTAKQSPARKKSAPAVASKTSKSRKATRTR